MSTHTVQDTEVDHVDTQGVIMKDTETTTTETVSSPAPSRPPRGVVTAAGLIVFATVTLTPWLLTSSSDSLRPITPTQAAAPTQQAAPAVQARASSNAGSAKPVAGYALFCQQPQPVRAGCVHSAGPWLRSILLEQPDPLRRLGTAPGIVR